MSFPLPFQLPFPHLYAGIETVRPPMPVLFTIVTVGLLVLWARNSILAKKNYQHKSSSVSSVFKSKAYHDKILAIYKQKLSEWPTHTSRYLQTQTYGTIHVLVSGPETGNPMILIPACGLGAWSWWRNVGAWNEAGYRTYAIDNVGEANRNRSNVHNHDDDDSGGVASTTVVVPPQTGTEIAEFYEDVIVHHLGIPEEEPVIVVGASIGGYIATQLAIHKPRRVDKLVLIGPMGFGISTAKIILIMICSMLFPIRWVQDRTLQWAFGNDPVVVEAFSEWFRLVMTGTRPNPIVPHSFSDDDLKKVTVSTLAFVAQYDSIVGRNVPHVMSRLKHIRNVQIQTVQSGHLPAIECPTQVNQQVLNFLRGE
eukprot:CAMPEP_0178732334 /NCGR_PEP_ID=MMETSP0744-20121128/208_1 /TAXON_ID=913974 /ORGANISM="Nitzschia punctata, Strain CCMP561" /LENGTH=366 /DNA_ID=CAMNT_0020384447 /DNA_START=238 /DNA_END=1338 /DNA_ORIENTATION=-